MNYEVVCENVRDLMQDDIFYLLAKCFAEVDDTQKIIQIVSEQYLQAYNGVDDFNLSIKDYLFLTLDDDLCALMLESDWFVDEHDAENNGYYWVDELNRWLKLDFNK